MPDHLVGARNKSDESEASQALMFCFDNASPAKCCFGIDPVCFCFAFLISCCVPECHQKEVKSSTAEKVFFFSFLRLPLRENRRRKGPHDHGMNCESLFIQAEKS